MVVPVYNPGADIEPCIASLLGQTLPPGELELVYVDDGSTDGTAARLDDLAAAHDHIRVIHQANSGWPGKPRNVGIDAARGEFVQFVDQDDSMSPDALERLWAYGTENAADIVIGKVTSDFRPVPHELWRMNRGRCSIWDAPLIESLTPHKMFRRSFLRDHQLRFPEGRRRLEDQVFMVAAYFATDAVAVLAEHPCYFYKARQEGQNSGAENVDPAGYYRNLREVLEIVEQHTEPGEDRDGLMRRFLQAIDRRVSGVATNASLPADYVQALFDEARAVAAERFSASLVAGLPVLRRRRVQALLNGRLDVFSRMAGAAAQLKLRAEVTDIAWTGSSWRVGVAAALVNADGRPLTLTRDESGWQPDERFAPAEGGARPESVENLIGSASASASIRARRSAVEWLLPAQLQPCFEPVSDGSAGPHTLRFNGTVDVDPAHAACDGRPEPGQWELILRARALGVTRLARVKAGRVPQRNRGALLRPKPVLAELGRATNDRLQLTLSRRSLTAAVTGRLGVAKLKPGRIVVPVDLRLLGGKPVVDVAASLTWPGNRSVETTAVIRRTEKGAVVRVDLPSKARRRSGPAAADVRLARKGKPVRIATVRFDGLRRAKEIVAGQ